jgi:hypothetical protein
MKASSLHAIRITTVTNCIAPLVAIRTHPPLYARYARIIGTTNVGAINTHFGGIHYLVSNQCFVFLSLHKIRIVLQRIVPTATSLVSPAIFRTNNARLVDIYELSPIRQHIRQQATTTLETHMYFKDFHLRLLVIQPKFNAKNLDKMLGTNS